MQCNHDLAERETAVADGHCPLCLLARINELEAKLQRYEMVHKQYLKEIHERLEKEYKEDICSQCGLKGEHVCYEIEG